MFLKNDGDDGGGTGCVRQMYFLVFQRWSEGKVKMNLEFINQNKM
jgi:hypothetical protein